MIYKGINFNGTHYQNGSDQVWCNWDDDSDYIFVGERHVVLIYSGAIDEPFVVYRALNNLRVDYTRDENDYFILDLTDYLRTFAGRNAAVDIYLDGGKTNFELLASWLQKFLRNSETIPVPKSTIEYLRITPPSRMLQSDAITIMAQSFIWQNAGAPSRQWRYRPIGGSTFTNLSNGVTFYIEESGVEISSNAGEKGTFEPAPTECGVRYAMIKWRSFVGPYKIHNFVVKSQKTETQGDYSLLMADNSYNVIKGSEESLIFSIDELTTYDLWYYSDILTSSEVSLLANDSEFIGSVSQGQLVGGIRLEITTNSVTIPSGERADGKLEFEAKIKRYDAVTL